jgi:putative ABC transport system permease protein
VGDTIEIENGDISRSYEITGFVQSVNYQGNVCELTMDGYEAVSAENVVKSLYVYLEQGADAEVFIKDAEKNHSDLIAKAVNSQEMEKKSQEMFSGITMVLIVVIFVLTMLIVLFILYIVIKSLLVQRKQESGIYKAIGYSNGQLILQMAGSFLPVSITAVLLSSVLALVYMPYMNQVIFQTVGAMKNNMEVSFVFLMIFAVIQIILNLVISICLAMPIKKISPYALIKE